MGKAVRPRRPAERRRGKALSMCPHMTGLLARYKRSPYGRRGRHDGFLSFALAVSEAASLGHIGAGRALATGVPV